MKLWAALTVFLYFVLLLLLTIPVLILLYGDWWGPSGGGISLKDSIGLYQEAGYWVWLGFMVISQAILLFTPARSRDRLPPRRALFVPILVTGFLLANLILCGIVCILCLCLSDKGVMVFAVIGEFVADDAAKMWGFLFGKAGILFSTNVQFAFGIITATAAFWLFWALVFYWFAKSDDPDSVVQRSTRWVMRGSIAELVVAVPTHIAVRQRQDCCAPVATLCGIATGLAVLLIAFGPGVYFLFVERGRRLRPGAKAETLVPKA
jgi:hypothetical protein